MKARIAIAMVAILIFSPIGESTRKDPFVRTIEKIKLSTVAVVCLHQAANGEPASITSIEGSGFFIDTTGAFLTAGHVAHGLFLTSPPRILPCEIPAIYYPQTGWQEGKSDILLGWFRIKKCVFSEDLDLAKCNLVVNPFIDQKTKIKPLPVSFDVATQEEGTEIAFTGFPLSVIQPITARGTVGSYFSKESEFPPREIVIDHNNWPGASGSAVYLKNGKVVGLLLKRGINDAVGLAYARSSVYLVKFLADNSTDK